MTQKSWLKPQIIVLQRATVEESVLTVCKGDTEVDSGNKYPTFFACYFTDANSHCACCSTCGIT